MGDNRAELSRRDFLRAAGAVGMGALLRPVSSWAQEEPQVVPKRPFGDAGVEVSVLGFGGTVDVYNSQLVLKEAVKYGVTYWDTAAGYAKGKSEKGFGKYLARYPEQRENIFLVTKPSRAKSVEDLDRFLGQSLENLKTDYIDLYLIHHISTVNQLDRPEVRAWVDQQKEAGKFRLFGFSAHGRMAQNLLDAAQHDWIDGVMVTYNYMIMNNDDMRAGMEACAEAGIGVTAMKTQGGRSGGRKRADEELLGHFLEKGFTAEQARLLAVWENEQLASACSNMPNTKILKANVAAALGKTKLSAADRRMLERHARATRSGYCAGCIDRCEPLVEEGPPIGDVMRSLMYYRSYGEPETARSTFRELPAAARQKLARLDYSAAERACPNKMPIARLMREAVTLFGT